MNKKIQITEQDLYAELAATLTPPPAPDEITVRSWAEYRQVTMPTASDEILRMVTAGILELVPDHGGKRIQHRRSVNAYRKVKK